MEGDGAGQGHPGSMGLRADVLPTDPRPAEGKTSGPAQRTQVDKGGKSSGTGVCGGCLGLLFRTQVGSMGESRPQGERDALSTLFMA